MSVSRSDRNETIDRVLTDLVALRGVTTAALVDEDGLVTHIRRDFDVDADALGAATQIMFASANRAARQVEQGGVKLILSENQDGMVLMSPVTRGFSLVVISDMSGMLGTVRFEIRESVPVLDRALAS